MLMPLFLTAVLAFVMLYIIVELWHRDTVLSVVVLLAALFLYLVLMEPFPYFYTNKT